MEIYTMLQDWRVPVLLVGFLGAQMVKRLSAMLEIWVRFLG